jgi:integrase/recombinase XerD
MLASLKSVFTFCYKTGFTSLNIGAALQLPKGKEKLSERILTEEQVIRMLAMEKNPRNHAILAVLYGAALRAAELCVLTWRDVQPSHGTGQLVIYGKGQKTRYVILKESTWMELQNLRQGDGEYVFQSRQGHSRKGEKRYGNKLDESQILHIVRNAARVADIPNADEVSPHWLRHAHASHSMDHGAPIALVQATLGHRSIETTGNYLHVRPGTSSAQYLNI